MKSREALTAFMFKVSISNRPFIWDRPIKKAFVPEGTA